MRYSSVKEEAFARFALNSFDDNIADELARRIEGFDKFEIEIGSGNGKFLVEHAMEREDVYFIGVEYSRKAVNKSVEKSEKRDLKNVSFILGEANTVLEKYLIGTILFDTAYLNFPDPWPKKKQLKRRIVNESFIALVHKVLKDSGEFYLVTDFEEYATETMSPIMEASSLYENAFDEKWKNTHDGYKVTLYEEKMRAVGKDIFYLKYNKK